MKSDVKKAIIPVAGLGTRFSPVTRSIPKEMLPIVDKPMIQIVVEEALAAGIEQIILVNGQHKGSIDEYFDVSMGPICTVHQREPLGLGDAVLCARSIVGDEPFAVLLGDDLIFTDTNKPVAIRQLIDAYDQTKVSQIAVQRVAREDVHKYGAVNGNVDNATFHIDSLVEKPPKGTERTDHVIVGRYVLTPTVWPILDQLVAKPGAEIQLTDALIELLKMEDIQGCLFEGKRVDAGDRVGYLQANLMQALARPELRDSVERMLRSL